MDALMGTARENFKSVAVLGKIFEGLAPHHLGGNNG